jgi:hypothetical protein
MIIIIQFHVCAVLVSYFMSVILQKSSHLFKWSTILLTVIASNETWWRYSWDIETIDTYQITYMIWCRLSHETIKLARCFGLICFNFDSASVKSVDETNIYQSL